MSNNYGERERERKRQGEREIVREKKKGNNKTTGRGIKRDRDI